MSDKSKQAEAAAADSAAISSDEREALSTLPPEVFVAEDQAQRWKKYGVNVVLTSVIVIVLAAILIWAAQGTLKRTSNFRGRADLTSDASNKLKPQTLAVIKDLPTEVTLVSLYPKLKKEEAADKGTDTYQRVLDILDEYRRNGRNIKVQMIDPIAEPGKLDAWIGEVKRKYGRNIENYEKFVKEFPKTLEEIKKLAAPEAERLRTLSDEINKSADKLDEEQVATLNRTLPPAYSTVAAFPRMLEALNDAAKNELEQKIPDYAGAVRVIKNGSGMVPGLVGLSRQCGALVTLFNNLKDDAKAPEAAKKYAVDAGPRYEAIKAKADDAIKRSEGLGEIKLDDVRKKLIPAEEGQTTPPAIVVMGPEDVRVIEDFSLWKSGETTGLTGAGSDKPRLRFAGEQQLTSAVLALAQTKKQRVTFVRSGGEPKTTFGMGGQPPFAEIADRLKAYNFEVAEKDFGMQMSQQRMPTPEPTEEQLKDSIWVVFASPDRNAAMMGMPSGGGQLGEKLKQHLEGGGSALCLMNLQADDLSAALKDWGIEAKTNAIVVHEKIKGGDADSTDFIEQARREPYIFVLNEFGDHAITRPLRSLDAAVVPMLPVKVMDKPPAGVTVTSIIPVPNNPPAWGETDLSAIMGGGRRQDPTFDKVTDLPQPLFAGAAAEKGKGRLVVIGAQDAFSNGLLNYPDPKLAKSKTIVSRFPGNGELFTNSIFWLARDEKMIALGTSALDAARIEVSSPAKLAFIKIGIVLITLPLLAIAAGVAVWFTRRA